MPRLLDIHSAAKRPKVVASEGDPSSPERIRGSDLYEAPWLGARRDGWSASNGTGGSAPVKTGGFPGMGAAGLNQEIAAMLAEREVTR